MPRKKKKNKSRHNKKKMSSPGFKYKTVHDFDIEMKQSASDLAMVYRFYGEVSDELFLGAVMVFNLGGISLVRDAMRESFMVVVDYLFLSSLCSIGGSSVLFLLKLPFYQELISGVMKTLEFRNKQIIESDGSVERYTKQDPILVGTFFKGAL